MKRKWISMVLVMGIVTTNLPVVNIFAEDIQSSGIEATTTVGTDTVGTDTVGTGTIGTDTAGTTTVTTSTAGEENSNVLDFVFDKSTGTISSYKGAAKIITIPSEIDGVAVKRIKGINKGISKHSLSMFTSEKGRNNVEKVIIPSSVEVIEQFTFLGCINLKEIELSEGLKKIGSNAFYGCSFERVNIPESVIEIRNGAFSHIDELKEINIPMGIKEIDYGFIEGCLNLEKITIPKDAIILGAPFIDSVWAKSIMDNNNGFYIINDTLCGYNGTNEIITIPDGVKTINREAFYDYTIPKEQNILLSNPINYSAAYNNIKVKEVTVPASVTLIKRYAFSNCTQLKSINIANPNVQIGGYCFRDNVAITRGNEVLTQAQIDNSKFDFDKSTGTITGYKGNETYLTIPSEIDGVKVSYIEASSELKAKGYGILGDNLTVEYLEISGSVKAIKGGAFQNNKRLTQVSFTSNGVGAIESGAFQGCSNLSRVFELYNVVNVDKDAFKDTDWQVQSEDPKISTTGGGLFDFNSYPDKGTPETGEKSNALLVAIMTILSGTFIYKSYKKKKIQR